MQARWLLLVAALLLPLTARADYLFAVSSLDTVTKPPLSVPNKGAIVAVVPQVRTASWSLWEVWAQSSDNQKFYRALVLRQPFTAGRLLWTFLSDSDLWFKYLTWWAGQDATLQGPVKLLDLQTYTQAQCEATASRTLVRVTYDSGALQPPPPVTVCTKVNDAGVPYNCSPVAQRWPDGGYLRCGAAGGYYLRQWRYGGRLGGSGSTPGNMNDQPLGPPSAPPPIGITDDVWTVPPAPTTRLCEVPVEQACP